MTIKNKVLITVSVIITVIIAILSTIGYNEAYKNFKIAVDHKLKSKVLEEATGIDNFITDKKHLIESLAETLGSVNYDEETHLKFMKKTKEIMGIYGVFSGFSDKSYFDTQGWIPPNDEWDP